MAQETPKASDPFGWVAWIATAWVMAKSLSVCLSVTLFVPMLERLYIDFGRLLPPIVQAVSADVVRGLLVATAVVALLCRATLGPRKATWVVLAIGWVFVEGIDTFWLGTYRHSFLELLK